MALRIEVIPGRHELVRLRMQSLIHAVDHEEAPVVTAFTRFVETVESHAALEYHLEYRALAEHGSQDVRACAARLLKEQPNFAARFEGFARRWRSGDADALRTPAFREDLDHMVAMLLTRILLEERLVAALASAA
jgi:hypothetical protein